jgi:hypothetical protein
VTAPADPREARSKADIIMAEDGLRARHPLRGWLRHHDHCPARRLSMDLTRLEGPCNCGLNDTLAARQDEPSPALRLDVTALYEAMPGEDPREWEPFWHRVDEPDGWVVSIYGHKLAGFMAERLRATADPIERHRVHAGQPGWHDRGDDCLPFEQHVHLRGTDAIVYARALAANPPQTREAGLLKVEGSIGSTLVIGTDYRVAEIREHHEPSGVEGVPPKVTTVVRFDPLPRSIYDTDPESYRQIERLAANPPQTRDIDHPFTPLRMPVDEDDRNYRERCEWPDGRRGLICGKPRSAHRDLTSTDQLEAEQRGLTIPFRDPPQTREAEGAAPWIVEGRCLDCEHRRDVAGCSCPCHPRTPEAQRDAEPPDTTISVTRPLNADSDWTITTPKYAGQRDAGNRGIDPDLDTLLSDARSRVKSAIGAAKSERPAQEWIIRVLEGIRERLDRITLERDIARATQPPAAGTEGTE